MANTIYGISSLLIRLDSLKLDDLCTLKVVFCSVSHVKVMGRSLGKSFRVMNPNDSGKFGLKVMSYSDPQEMDEMEVEEGQSPFRPMRNLEQLLNFLHRHPLDVEYVWPESENEDDESDDEV